MASELDEKQVKGKAKELLNQGTSKQETYAQLTKEFGHPTITAEILKRIPSKQAWRKYGIWNHLLSGLMICLFLIVFSPNPTIGTFIWYGLPTVAIITRKTRVYFWIAILAIIGTMTIVALGFTSSDKIQTDGVIMMLIYSALLLPAAISSNMAPKKANS